MRSESPIVVKAADTVGPVRLQLLTAGSAKLPVVVLGEAGEPPAFHVFDVSSLQAELADQLSATHMDEALRLSERPAREPVAPGDAPTAETGTPIVENGRLIGVVAADVVEPGELTEEDFARAASEKSKKLNPAEGKRTLWQRFSRSGG
ncbi:MAG TPA: TCAD7 domain-containing protein [Mycobacterium sp.]